MQRTKAIKIRNGFWYAPNDSDIIRSVSIGIIAFSPALELKKQSKTGSLALEVFFERLFCFRLTEPYSEERREATSRYVEEHQPADRLNKRS